MIPDSVKMIHERAFEKCQINNICFEGELEKIPANCFNKANMESLILKKPESLKQIGDYAFDEAVAFSTKRLPKAIENVGAYAFHEAKFTDEDMLDFYQIKNIGEYAFWRANMRKIQLPNNIESIGSYAFGDCQQLISATTDKAPKLHENGFVGYGAFSNNGCYYYELPESIVAEEQIIRSAGELTGVSYVKANNEYYVYDYDQKLLKKIDQASQPDILQYLNMITSGRGQGYKPNDYVKKSCFLAEDSADYMVDFIKADPKYSLQSGKKAYFEVSVSALDDATMQEHAQYAIGMFSTMEIPNTIAYKKALGILEEFEDLYLYQPFSCYVAIGAVLENGEQTLSKEGNYQLSFIGTKSNPKMQEWGLYHIGLDGTIERIPCCIIEDSQKAECIANVTDIGYYCLAAFSTLEEYVNYEDYLEELHRIWDEEATTITTDEKTYVTIKADRGRAKCDYFRLYKANDSVSKIR